MFAQTLETTATKDDDQDAIPIEESSEGPRIEARNNRSRGRYGTGDSDGKGRAKPFRKGGNKPPFKGKRDRDAGEQGEGRPDRKRSGHKNSFGGKPKDGKPSGKPWEGKPGGGPKPKARRPSKDKGKPKGKIGGKRPKREQ